MNEPLVNARQLAGYLGVSPDTVLDWFEAGKLPGFRLTGRVGAPVRFRRNEVEACLEQWRVGTVVPFRPVPPMISAVQQCPGSADNAPGPATETEVPMHASLYDPDGADRV